MDQNLMIYQENQIASWGVLVKNIPQSQGPVYVISVIGDSMFPTVSPGQRVAIDTGHRVPSPGGIYAIYDGYTLTLKRIERDMEAEAETYIVSSDNQAYRTFRIGFGEQTPFIICGRMLASWQSH